MSWPKSIAVLFLLLTMGACTPGYFRQQSEFLAEQARLSNSIQIERSNQRLLVRQAQICLASADGGSDAGAVLLRTVQAGFSGYFLGVGVAGESIDYLQAVSTPPCPDASFLFYVQPAEPPACDVNQQCRNNSTEFTITVVSVGDQSLVDRIQLSIRDSFLSADNQQQRQQKGFEKLAIALTGAQ